jgi:hypothetical protein
MAVFDAQPAVSPFPDVNALYPAQQGQWLTNQATQIANQFAPQRNQLALETGQEALSQARQKDPLEILQLRQQLGLDPNPVFDRLMQLYQTPTTPFEKQMGTSEAPNASAVNPGGYSGQYQFGAARLADLGLYKPSPGEDLSKNQWTGTFNIPPYNVTTHDQFLASPAAQHAAFQLHVANIDQAIANTPGADKLDPNGLRAVAHLGGVGGMQKFVATGGAYDPPDANGVRLSDYYKKFAAGGAPLLQQTFGSPHGPAGPQQAPAATPGAAPGAPAIAPVQVAGPGAPTAPGPPSVPGGQPAPPPAATPGGPAAAVAPAVAPAPTPAGPPRNALAPPAVAPAPAPAPAGTPAPAAVPATGLNSPQVQQAQQLLRQATQIELAAAASPLDPRVKAAAAAMAGDLRARAAVLMQADSTIIDPVTHVQTSTLTGKQSDAAKPAANYQPSPDNPGVLVSPGLPPVVLPAGRAVKLADGSTAVIGPGGTFKIVTGPDYEGTSAAAAATAAGNATAAATAKLADQLPDMARTATQAIGNIDYGLSQLDKAKQAGIPTGYFAPALAEAAAAAKYLGITYPGVKAEAVGDIQTASKTLAVVSGAILQNIVGKGEITEGKIEAYIHAQPGIVNDPDAIHKILSWARTQFVYDREMAADGLKNINPQSGILPPGWRASYMTTHGAGPIYDPGLGEMMQPDGRAPSREPPPTVSSTPMVVKSASDYAAVPSGQTYVDPDGHTRRKP